MATLRRLIGEAKAPVYAEMVVEELKNGRGKVVVFAVHRRALDIVADALGHAGVRCVRVDGSTSERGRVDAVEQFQNEAHCRVFLGNIRAAGTGLTLTAAHDLDLLEWSWSPADNAQAIMRVHRISQTEHVNARMIALANSFDQVVTKVVRKKTAAIAQVEGQEP